MEWQVALNNNSFDRAGITKDCKEAICEYIWNGFEAGATKVVVKQNGNPLREAMSIEVVDNGSGIHYDSFEDTFVAFLSSLKNKTDLRIKSQYNKGKGRFSYQCFAASAEWRTIFEQDGIKKHFSIKTNPTDKSKFITSQPLILDTEEDCGTSVEFPISDSKTLESLSFGNMKQKLFEEFAWFLYLNKNKNFTLEYMGVELDTEQYIDTELSSIHKEIIDGDDFEINIIVWKKSVANSSKIFYLTPIGEIVEVENTSFNKNTVGFDHAVFVSSNYFEVGMFFPQEIENDQLVLDSQSVQRNTLRILKKKISSIIADTLKSFLITQADKRLFDMEKRGTVPSFSDDEYGQLRKKDFQQVTRELYCVEPKIFHRLNDTQEKSLLGFLNLLLFSEERENVLLIIEQIVSLTPEERKNFAEVLQRSKLQYIIEAISIIEKRITVIENLKNIVFEMTSFANERDHIQKIAEQHFWLFGEQYHLLTADKNMNTSLQEFEKITETSNGVDSSVLSQQEASQRMDIFLYTQRLQENATSEMLVVELKAPYVRLSLDVYNQIVRYATTIRKEPRFNGTNRIWKFLAVCANVDEDVKTKYSNFEQHGKKGLVDVIGNFEIYALSWDDVFQSFEARHNFLLERLKLDFSQISAFESSNEAQNARSTVTELTSKLIAIDA